MSVKLDNITCDDTCQILCEYCQDGIQEGLDDLVLYSDCLYHKQCWLKKTNDWYNQITKETSSLTDSEGKKL